MNFSKIADRAKGLIQRRGGTEALKQDAQELKDIAKGEGSLSDKAKAAAEAIKEPGATGNGGPAEPAAAAEPAATEPAAEPQPEEPATEPHPTPPTSADPGPSGAGEPGAGEPDRA